MKYVELPLVDKEACEKALARDGSSYHLHDSMICAGGVKDEDTCKGDGGGPLVCRRKTFAGEGEVYVQVKICELQSLSSIKRFTNMGKFSDSGLVLGSIQFSILPSNLKKRGLI